MKRALVLMSILALISVGTVFASGSAEKGGSSASGTAQNSTSGSSTLPSGQSLLLWAWVGGPQFKAVDSFAQAWAKKHGDTVKVINESQNPNGFQFYATAARTGKGPDVLLGMPHDNNGLFVEEGLLAPVPSGVINVAAYPKSVIEASTVNGKLYSVPYGVGTYALVYNKSLVPSPPKTWNQFVQDANAHGFMFDQANLYFNYAFIGGMGGYVFKNNNGTLNPNQLGLNSPGAVAAFSLLHNMDAKYHWMTPSTTGAVAKAQFLSGKIGMYLTGPWDTPDIKKAGIDYAWAPLPTLPNGHKATPFMSVYTTFVNAKSKTHAADWSLVKAITSAKAQKTYFDDGQQLPALTSLQKSSDIQSNPDFAALAQEIPTAVPMPNIPQMQAVWNAMKVVGNIIKGSVSPQQGANDFVKNVKKGIQVQGS